MSNIPKMGQLPSPVQHQYEIRAPPPFKGRIHHGIKWAPKINGGPYLQDPEEDGASPVM